MSDTPETRHRFQVSLLMAIAAVGTSIWILWIRDAGPITTIVFWSVFGWGYLLLVLAFHYLNGRQIARHAPRP